MRTIMLTAALLAALVLSAGCSVEQGGTEDPEGFATVQGLEQPGASSALPADAPQALPAQDMEARLAAVEGENARLRARLNELEARLAEQVDAMHQRLAALEERGPASQGSLGGESGNLDRGEPLIDLGDDKAFEEQVVRQGLEQIVNMSRLLLDKMEYEMNEQIAPENGGEASESGFAGSGTK